MTLIEAHYGAPLDTARDAILERLDAIESALRQTGNEHEKSGRRSVWDTRIRFSSLRMRLTHGGNE